MSRYTAACYSSAALVGRHSKILRACLQFAQHEDFRVYPRETVGTPLYEVLCVYSHICHRYSLS